MKYIDRVERVLKDLCRLTNETLEGAESLGVLEKKVEAYRLQKILQKARHDIRVKYFELEDLSQDIERNKCT